MIICVNESIDKPTRKVILKESQIPLLKEYYAQTVFNFDKDGNPYFKKDNYQHYIDFLETIGRYGQLPRSEWNKYNIHAAIEGAEDYAIESYEGNYVGSEDIEDRAMYRFIENLLDNRDNVNFEGWLEDSFEDPSIIECFKRFGEWFEKFYDKGYVPSYVDERVVSDFLEDGLKNSDYECFYDSLTPSGQDELRNFRNTVFLDERLTYDFPDSLVFNDRGLIYVEREITIPQFDGTDFYYHRHYDNYYNFLKTQYNGVGQCWSWAEDFSEAYDSNHYPDGTTHLTLKGWVDPQEVDWEETLYRNCYGLNHEREMYLSSGTPIEINSAEINGKNILEKPIIVYT